MAKIRVFELARDLNMTNKELVERMRDLDISVVSHLSSMEDEDVAKIKENVVGEKLKKGQAIPVKPTIIRRRRDVEKNGENEVVRDLNITDNKMLENKRDLDISVVSHLSSQKDEDDIKIMKNVFDRKLNIAQTLSFYPTIIQIRRDTIAKEVVPDEKPSLPPIPTEELETFPETAAEPDVKDSGRPLPAEMPLKEEKPELPDSRKKPDFVPVEAPYVSESDKPVPAEPVRTEKPALIISSSNEKLKTIESTSDIVEMEAEEEKTALPETVQTEEPGYDAPSVPKMPSVESTGYPEIPLVEPTALTLEARMERAEKKKLKKDMPAKIIKLPVSVPDLPVPDLAKTPEPVRHHEKNLTDTVKEVFDAKFPFSLISNVILYQNDRKDRDLLANEIDFIFHYFDRIHRIVIVEVKNQSLFGLEDGFPLTSDGPWNARYPDKIKDIKHQLSDQVSALKQYCNQISSNVDIKIEAWVVDTSIGSRPIESTHGIKPLYFNKNAFINKINEFPYPVYRITNSIFLMELRRGMALSDTGHPEIPNAIRFIENCRKNLDSRLYKYFDPTEKYYAINGCAGMGKSVLLAYGLYVLATDHCVNNDNFIIQLKPYKETAIKKKWPLHENRKIYAYAVKKNQIDALESYWVLIKEQISKVNPNFQPALQVPKFDIWKGRIPPDCNCLIIDESHDLSLDDQKMIADWAKKDGRFLMVACDRNQAIRRKDDSQNIIYGLNFSLHTSRLNRIYRCPFPVHAAAIGLLFRWFAQKKVAITFQEHRDTSNNFGFKKPIIHENGDITYSMRNDCHPGNNWQQTVSYFSTPQQAHTYISEFNLKGEKVLWACFEKTSDNFDYKEILKSYTLVDLSSNQAEDGIDSQIKGQDFAIVFVEGLPQGMNPPEDMVQNSHKGEEQSESEKKMWEIRKYLYIVCSRASAFLYFVNDIDNNRNTDSSKEELKELIHQVSRPTSKKNESGKHWTFTIKAPEISRTPSEFIDMEEHRIS